MATVLVASASPLRPSAEAASSTRLGGADRFATAAIVAADVASRRAVDTVYLVTGANFPDALVAGVGDPGSVVLLTRADTLPWVTFLALLDARYTRVVVVGGISVVSGTVEAIVRGLGKTVTRLAGTDRYGTSRAVVEANTTRARATSLWLAPGTSFVDQMNAMAAAVRAGGVMALVPPSSNATSVLRALESRVAADAPVHVIDSQRVLPTITLGTRSVTVHDDSAFVESASMVGEASQVVMASGENWPDALSASRLVSSSTALVLARSSCVPEPVRNAVGARRLTVVGGPAAMSDAAVGGQACAIGEPPSAAPLSTCQVPDQRVQRNQPYSVGFPLTPGAEGTPSSGRFPVVVFPVDFADVPGQPSDIARMKRAVAFVGDWLRTESNGTLSADWRVSETWINLPRPSIEYDTPKGEAGYVDKAVAVASEIIALADPTTNFAGNPFVFFVFPQALVDIDTDVGYFSASIATGEGRVSKFFGGGHFFNVPDPYDYSQPRDLGSFWLHEIGHTWGLAGHAPTNIVGSNRLGADLHLMDNQNGLTYVLSAWDQLLTGWLLDRELYCVHADDVESFEMTLQALESTAPGRRSIMMRLSPSRMLVIESHRPIGYGARIAPHPGGVVAYVVDTAVENDRTGEGTGEARTRYAQYLAPVNPSGSPRSRGQVDPIIVTGGSASYGDITVSVVAGGASDLVRITQGSSID